ncbi:calcitonin gene-related peptide type 1 receptor [Sergentomyia squamirostris]
MGMATTSRIDGKTILPAIDEDFTEIRNSRTQEVKALITRLYYECMKTDWNASEYQSISGDPPHSRECPKTFDGYLCWPPTSPGTTVSQHCPDFVTGFDSSRLAYKTCLPNGTWFSHPETGNVWSNYTTCVDIEDFEFRQLVNDLYTRGYTISLATLIISLIIFLSFRVLRCTRIKIHIHLFISLAFTCTAWILWYKFIVEKPDTIRDNSKWCVTLHIVLHYLMLVNYFWMFCEGLHLHLVLVVVFVKDAVAMRWFMVIGWFLPIILVSVYAGIRGNNPMAAKHCWMEDSELMWILTIPVCISLIASMVFLINVVRVLLTKLHPCSAQPAPVGLRKAVRATLILVPLFGLQHILLPFRPDTGSPLEKYYQIASAILVSLQGFSVSCLFCFMNHDVIFALWNLLSRLFPSITPTMRWESVNGPQATQSRDVVV